MAAKHYTILSHVFKATLERVELSMTNNTAQYARGAGHCLICLNSRLSACNMHPAASERGEALAIPRRLEHEQSTS